MFRITLCLPTVGLLSVILAVPWIAPAAELRTTAGERPVSRRASGPQPPELQMVGFVEAVTTDVIKADTYSHACAACGVPGCAMGCLQSCGWWADLEYLLWWRRGRDLPPLVTDGVLPGATVLFGNGRLGGDARPGGRVTIGTWLDACQMRGVEGRFYSLGSETIRFNASSDGSTILARPFINTDPLDGLLGPTARLLADASRDLAGSVEVTSQSEVLGGDALFRFLLCDTGCVRIDFLAGYQFGRIDEDLMISDSREDTTSESTNDIEDLFRTRNEFHGGQLGLETSWLGPCWRMELLAKIAFGNMRQTVDIMGRTTNTVPMDPDSPFFDEVGLLARVTNQESTFQQNKFAVVPEVGIRVFYQLNDCFDLSVGYSYIYWSDAVQPGDQIPFSSGGPISPFQFEFVDSSFWVHGLNLGAEVRF